MRLVVRHVEEIDGLFLVPDVQNERSGSVGARTSVRGGEGTGRTGAGRNPHQPLRGVFRNAPRGVHREGLAPVAGRLQHARRPWRPARVEESIPLAQSRHAAIFCGDNVLKARPKSAQGIAGHVEFFEQCGVPTHDEAIRGWIQSIVGIGTGIS